MSVARCLFCVVMCCCLILVVTCCCFIVVCVAVRVFLLHDNSLLVVWSSLLVVVGVLMLRAGAGVVDCGSGLRFFLLLLDSYCMVLWVVCAVVCCAVFALVV